MSKQIIDTETGEVQEMEVQEVAVVHQEQANYVQQFKESGFSSDTFTTYTGEDKKKLLAVIGGASTPLKEWVNKTISIEFLYLENCLVNTDKEGKVARPRMLLKCKEGLISTTSLTAFDKIQKLFQFCNESLPTPISEKNPLVVEVKQTPCKKGQAYSFIVK